MSDLRLFPSAVVALLTCTVLVKNDVLGASVLALMRHIDPGPGTVLLIAAAIAVCVRSVVAARRILARCVCTHSDVAVPSHNDENSQGAASAAWTQLCLCIVVMCVVACTYSVHCAVRHPQELIDAAAARRIVDVRVRILQDPSAIKTRWGSSQCQTRASVLVVGKHHGAHISSSGVSTNVGVSGVQVRSRGIRLLIRNVPCQVRLGMEIHATGRLQPLAHRRESAALTVNSATIVRQPPWIYRQRAKLVDATHTVLRTFPEHAQALIPGIGLGDTTFVSQDVADQLRIVGLSHIIAVSGAHVSLVMGGVLIVLGRRRRLSAALGCATVVAGLVILVQSEASVVRAALMGALAMLALAIGTRANAMTSLCLVSLLLSMTDPWMASSYGFLLSVSAVAGIVLFADSLSARLTERIPHLSRSLASVIATTLVAQTFSLPISATFSPHGSPWSVLVNAAVALAVAPITVLSLCGVLLSAAWPALAYMLFRLASAFTWYMAAFAEFFAAITRDEFPAWVAWILCAGGCLLIWWGKPAIAAFLTLVLGLWNILPVSQDSLPEPWAFVICDVGQGSAFLARTTSGSLVMIDTGPEDGHVVQCLDAAHVDHIDLLVLSHDHADHIGGLRDVASHVPITSVWQGPNLFPRENQQWVSSVARTRSLAPHVVWRSNHPDYSDVDILWPRDQPESSDKTANADSLVLRVHTPAGTVIVMADAGKESQDAMLRSDSTASVRGEGSARLQPPASSIQSDYIVIAHHGSSDQSEAFARAVRARMAFVSAGTNTYGHPTRKALSLYGSVPIRSTRECSTIAVVEGGQSTCDLAAEPG
ncbi:MAG: ComEC/Rec2 family competence protein [Actinomycetaceae bacterium]|nr:ComEC/Rec2 family competence protein [Actinomycetaceae bacterium]MDY6083117.1 ComEC/Rec2 family competence protein [Actinomycetaceae bacterium]